MAGSYLDSDKSDAMQYIKYIYITSVKRDSVDKYSITKAVLLDTYLRKYKMGFLSIVKTQCMLKHWRG